MNGLTEPSSGYTLVYITRVLTHEGVLINNTPSFKEVLIMLNLNQWHLLYMPSERPSWRTDCSFLQFY